MDKFDIVDFSKYSKHKFEKDLLELAAAVPDSVTKSDLPLEVQVKLNQDLSKAAIKKAFKNAMSILLRCSYRWKDKDTQTFIEATNAEVLAEKQLRIKARAAYMQVKFTEEEIENLKTFYYSIVDMDFINGIKSDYALFDRQQKGGELQALDYCTFYEDHSYPLIKKEFKSTEDAYTYLKNLKQAGKFPFLINSTRAEHIVKLTPVNCGFNIIALFLYEIDIHVINMKKSKTLKLESQDIQNEEN